MKSCVCMNSSAAASRSMAQPRWIVEPLLVKRYPATLDLWERKPRDRSRGPRWDSFHEEAQDQIQEPTGVPVIGAERRAHDAGVVQRWT